MCYPTVKRSQQHCSCCSKNETHLAGSFRGLGFLVPSDTTLDHPGSSGQRLQHKKFVVFFDSKNEAASAGHHLRWRLPLDQRHKVIWFISDMSAGFKEDAITDLASGKIMGICTTDTYGMVSTQTFSSCTSSDIPSGYGLE